MPLHETVPPRVTILLSSYNGEHYLHEQLDSLFAQDYPNLQINVRDDGSTDKTLAILDEYAAQHANIHIDRGSNLGVARSFFRLLTDADPTSAYYAFCDQDDVWLSDKISMAVAELSAHDDQQPTLYFSRVEYVNAQLDHLGFSKKPHRPGFGNALVENCAPGCTMLFNRRARDLLITRPPMHMFVHDSWIYLSISAFGKLVYHDVARIKYRQHSTNTIGAATTSMARFRSRLRRQKQTREYLLQAKEFFDLYGNDLPPGKQRVLRRFLNHGINLTSRIAYAIYPDVWRQSFLDNLLLRVLLLVRGY